MPRKTRSDALPMPTMEWLRDRAIVTDAGCWEWQRATNGNGYGKFCRQPKTYSVHRYAWELANGSIPVGMFVCHRCDNRPCFNPAHLFLGTITKNNRDAWSKGRGVSNWPSGERHPHARLTVADVRDIRTLRDSGMEYEHIASRFGVSVSAACRAALRQTWKDVA